MFARSNTRFIGSCLLSFLLAPSVALAAPLAYVPSWCGNCDNGWGSWEPISVVDTADNRIVATVPTVFGGSPIAANAAGTRVLFRDYDGDNNNSLSVVDTANNAVVARIRVPNGNVQDVAVNAAGTRAYVSARDDPQHEPLNTVSVVDLATNTLLGSVPFGPYWPGGIAMDPASTRVYVVANGQSDDELWVIDAATNAVVTRIAGPRGLWKIAVDATGTRLYVGASNSLSIVDTTTNAIVATQSIGDAPAAVAVDPAGKRVYVVRSNDLLTLDAATLDIIATIPIGSTGWYQAAIATDPAGWHIYVVRDNDVAVIDTATNTLVATIAVAGSPTGIAVSAAIPAAVNYQGLWWVAGGAEDGWGINLAHAADQIFATWYTYDTTGKAWWLSMLAARTPGTNSFSGAILVDTGPSLDQFVGQGAAREVGSATFEFSDASHGTFTYNLDAGAGGSPVPISQQKAIERYDLYTGAQPTCIFYPAIDLTLVSNYQGLWWEQTGSESGWGVNFAHQGNAVFATWYTYDPSGAPLWLSALVTRAAGSASYTGTLYRTSGPRFDAYDMTKLAAAPVGTTTLTFSDGNHAKFEYVTQGGGGLPAVTQSKSITRFPFGAAGGGTVCY